VLCKLDLQASLTRPCSRSKHVEDQGGPVENLTTTQFAFQVSLLSGRQFVVADDRVDLKAATDLIKFP
jgi:hypothetical protein